MKKIFLFTICFISLMILPKSIFAQDRIHVITVSSYGSDAIILESDGHFAMIDTGEDYEYPDGSNPKYPFRKGITTNPEDITEDRLFSKIKELGINKFDFIIVTHSHSDHIGACHKVMKKIPTEKLYLKRYSDSRITDKARLWDNLYGYDKALQSAKENNVKVIQDISKKDSVINLGNMKISMLNYENEYEPNLPKEDKNLKKVYDDNFNSILSIVEVNGKRLFFGGDLQNDVYGLEDKYAPLIGKVDFMKFNHHVDTAKSNSKNFINTLNPKYMLKTSNYNVADNYLKFLDSKGIKVLNAGRNDVSALTFEITRNGINDITKVKYGVYKDGNKLKFKNWKGEYTSGWEFSKDNWYYIRNGSVAINEWIGDYYLGKDGKMLTNTTTPDGYRVDKNGRWITGSWKSNSTGWWYEYSDGSYLKEEWKYISGSWYYFNSVGYMVTGWKLLGNDWFYLKDSGAMAENEWIGDYYLGKGGYMLTNTTTPDGYKVDKNGKWITGAWKSYNGIWWYEYSDGSYLKEEWKYISGSWYYFNSGGYMVTGWKLLGNDWFYLKDSGAMAENEWIGYYYLGKGGYMLTNTTTPDGYKVDKNGRWIK